MFNNEEQIEGDHCVREALTKHAAAPPLFPRTSLPPSGKFQRGFVPGPVRNYVILIPSSTESGPLLHWSRLLLNGNIGSKGAGYE